MIIGDLHACLIYPVKLLVLEFTQVELVICMASAHLSQGNPLGQGLDS
jgi:hypothetical protein